MVSVLVVFGKSRFLLFEGGVFLLSLEGGFDFVSREEIKLVIRVNSVKWWGNRRSLRMFSRWVFGESFYKVDVGELVK